MVPTSRLPREAADNRRIFVRWQFFSCFAARISDQGLAPGGESCTGVGMGDGFRRKTALDTFLTGAGELGRFPGVVRYLKWCMNMRSSI